MPEQGEATFGRYRLVFRDPMAGDKRVQRSYGSREAAWRGFDEAVEYVRALAWRHRAAIG